MELTTKVSEVGSDYTLTEGGVVEMVVGATENIDLDGDRIKAGTFDVSYSKRTPKGVWSHDTDRPIAKTLEAKEILPGDSRLPQTLRAANAGAVYVKGQFNMLTSDGRDAYNTIKFYADEAEYSVGFRPLKMVRAKDAINITELDWIEWSPVIFGANPLTQTLSSPLTERELTIVKSLLGAQTIKGEAELNDKIEELLAVIDTLSGKYEVLLTHYEAAAEKINELDQEENAEDTEDEGTQEEVQGEASSESSEKPETVTLDPELLAEFEGLVQQLKI